MANYTRPTSTCPKGHTQQGAIYVTHVIWTAHQSLQVRTHNYDPSCAINMQRRIRMVTIHCHQHSSFVVTTKGTTLIKRCSGQSERAADLEAGIYQLPGFPCSLHRKDWTLKTTFTRVIIKTPRTDLLSIPVNCTINHGNASAQ